MCIGYRNILKRGDREKDLCFSEFFFLVFVLFLIFMFVIKVIMKGILWMYLFLIEYLKILIKLIIIVKELKIYCVLFLGYWKINVVIIKKYLDRFR